jgi:hypothetical protein
MHLKRRRRSLSRRRRLSLLRKFELVSRLKNFTQDITFKKKLKNNKKN